MRPTWLGGGRDPGCCAYMVVDVVCASARIVPEFSSTDNPSSSSVGRLAWEAVGPGSGHGVDVALGICDMGEGWL